MAKLASGANPKPIAGRKVQPGVISGIANRTPQEITGGNGVQVQQVGNRLIIKGTAGRGGTGAGFDVQEVSALPPIPASGTRIVYWKTNQPDDGHWIARAGWTAWRPMDCLTNRSGVPV